MTRHQLLELHKDTCNKCRELMARKNQDYAGGSEDPFANFTAGEILGIPSEMGILLRSLDKFQRIKSFVNAGVLAVADEPVDDAIEDVINYMILLKGIIHDKRRQRAEDCEGFEVIPERQDPGL